MAMADGTHEPNHQGNLMLSDALPIDVTRRYSDGDVGLDDDIDSLTRRISHLDFDGGASAPLVDPSVTICEFIKYADMFDRSDQNIERKVRHSMRVALLAVQLAREARAGGCGYGADIDLGIAFLTGLLHDAGRFPQFAMHRSYDDLGTRCDHGDLGAALLSEYGLLGRFMAGMGDEPTQEATWIIESVRWHNKKALPAGLDASERAYGTLVRDADIIDILRLWVTGRMGGLPFDALGHVMWSDLSLSVRQAVRERRTADRRGMRTEGDRAIGKALLPWELSEIAKRSASIRTWIRFE